MIWYQLYHSPRFYKKGNSNFELGTAICYVNVEKGISFGHDFYNGLLCRIPLAEVSWHK